MFNTRQKYMCEYCFSTLATLNKNKWKLDLFNALWYVTKNASLPKSPKVFKLSTLYPNSPLFKYPKLITARRPR